MAQKKTSTDFPAPSDQAQRDLIVSELSRNMLVEAAAGTGKTTSMIGRMLALLKTGSCDSVGSMAAVTFTRKAAAELRARFQVALERAVVEESGQAKARVQRALDAVSECFIGTIHSFCGRLLRERPVEAQVDPGFEEIDEETDARLRKQAWDAYLNRGGTYPDGGPVVALEELGLAPLDIEETFLRFADYPDVESWPVRETNELELDLNSIAEQLIDYAAHMRSLNTHLTNDWGNDKLIPEYFKIPRIVSHYESLQDSRDLMSILQRFDKNAKPVQKIWKSCGYDKERALAEQSRWDEFRADVAEPALKAWREYRYAPIVRILLEAQVQYDELRRAAGLLSYQDLLMKAAGLLRDKPHVREYFAQRFTHLLVDEFQDTDPIQAEVMLLLTADDPSERDWRKARPRPGSLFVVGDPKQSIYRFRRADIVTYDTVKKIIADERHGQGMVAQLSANFRTTGSVIDWVNNVFEPREDSEPGAMRRFEAVDSPESPAYVRLDVGRVEGNEGTFSGVYALTVPSDIKKQPDIVQYEADRIARFVRYALDSDAITIPRTRKEIDQGASPRLNPADILIINRNRKWLSAYARALQELDVPVEVTGGSALNEVSELRLLHTCLTALIRSDDPIALLALLRSELFGFSDAALFDFKRHGGRFSFRSEVPDGFSEPWRHLFHDCFTRLREYAGWISRLPAISAVEMIVADMGIGALAASGPMGEMEAGSLCKATEILRTVSRESWSMSQLLEQLGRLVDAEERYDGVSARSGDRPAVRIMNLHKCKGLEAPVVFLANPLGDSDHQVDLHVDRSGGRATGYLAVRGQSRSWSRQTLALPTDWDELSAKEDRFLRAENLRLKYVAATRAGAAMIISSRKPEAKNSPWRQFEESLDSAPEIGDPPRTPALELRGEAITLVDMETAKRNIDESVSRSAGPTYDSRGAKEFALSGAAMDREVRIEQPEAVEGEGGVSADRGEFGIEWGTLIHGLMELAMNNPDADLLDAAKVNITELDLEPELAESAAETVRGVMGSEMWKRALNSPHRMVEVPFEIQLSPEHYPELSLPTLVRGAIDLVFKEEDGWVIVDYKTDRVTPESIEKVVSRYAPQIRLYADAWGQCVGEPVKETAFYFVRTNQYVVARPAEGL